MATISQTLAREPCGKTAMHWIGGQWLDSGEHRESINPATGEVIGSYAYGGRKEAELAVNAALRAFRETDWRDSRSLRSRVLNAMAARLEAHSEQALTVFAGQFCMTGSRAMANDSEYGLAASVWSRDVDWPLRVARVLQAGTIWINDWGNIHDEFEEGGLKQSGPGRLRGQEGLDDFLECKHIAFKPGSVKGPGWDTWMEAKAK